MEQNLEPIKLGQTCSIGANFLVMNRGKITEAEA